LPHVFTLAYHLFVKPPPAYSADKETPGTILRACATIFTLSVFHLTTAAPSLDFPIWELEENLMRCKLILILHCFFVFPLIDGGREDEIVNKYKIIIADLNINAPSHFLSCQLIERKSMTVWSPHTRMNLKYFLKFPCCTVMYLLEQPPLSPLDIVESKQSETKFV
jgi:hypothetical protein